MSSCHINQSHHRGWHEITVLFTREFLCDTRQPWLHVVLCILLKWVIWFHRLTDWRVTTPWLTLTTSRCGRCATGTRCLTSQSRRKTFCGGTGNVYMVMYHGEGFLKVYEWFVRIAYKRPLNKIITFYAFHCCMGRIFPTIIRLGCIT